MNALFFHKFIPVQIVILFILSSSIIRISCHRFTQLKLHEDEEQREFDYFLLSLLWPATQCRGTRNCCSSNACCLGSKTPTQFTIHGLWTDYNDGTWPACCTKSKFEKKEITCLLSAMEKYWPTYTCDNYSTCNSGDGLFWAREWEKHGTCSSPVIRDEYSYFTTTLNIFFKYNVTTVLNKAGFVASDSKKYPLKGIMSAIQKAFHATPLLTCVDGAVDELRLCFYKDFKPRDCLNGSSIPSTEDSCPEYVSFPKHALPSLKEEETPVVISPHNASF